MANDDIRKSSGFIKRNKTQKFMEVADPSKTTHSHARTHAHTRTPARAQFNHKTYKLGTYAVEADAAAARDVVAKVLGYPLNFKKTRKIAGQRSKCADKLVADAVKAANACVLGNSMAVGFIHNESPKS